MQGLHCGTRHYTSISGRRTIDTNDKATVEVFISFGPPRIVILFLHVVSMTKMNCPPLLNEAANQTQERSAISISTPKGLRNSCTTSMHSLVLHVIDLNASKTLMLLGMLLMITTETMAY